MARKVKKGQCCIIHVKGKDAGPPVYKVMRVAGVREEPKTSGIITHVRQDKDYDPEMTGIQETGLENLVSDRWGLEIYSLANMITRKTDHDRIAKLADGRTYSTKRRVQMVVIAVCGRIPPEDFLEKIGGGYAE